MALAIAPDEMMPDAAGVRMYQLDLEGRFGTPWMGLLRTSTSRPRRSTQPMPALGEAQEATLRYLDDWGLSLTEEIATSTGREESRVRGALDKLRKKGLVEEAGRLETNAKYWRLTESGRLWANQQPASAPIAKAAAAGRTKRTGPTPRREKEAPAVYEVPRVYLETGVRWMTEAEVNAEHGPIIPGELDEAQRWAHMADGRIEPVSLQGPIPTRKLTTAAKRRKSSGKAKNSFDPITDPRRDQVLALYAAGMPMYKVSKTCHMEDATAKAILRSAGVYREAGATSSGHQSSRGKLTAVMVREILASDEPTAVLVDRFKVGATTVRKVRAGTTWRHVDRQEPKV